MAVVQVFKGLAGAVVEVDMKELKRSPDLVAYIRQRFFWCSWGSRVGQGHETFPGEVELLEPSKSWQEHGCPPELHVLLEHRDMSPEAHAQVMAIVCPEGQWVRETSPLGQQQLREVLQKTHPDVRDEHGVPLLHQMVKHASPYVAELARAGADLNLKQATGETAMEVALVRLVEYGFSTHLSSILQLLTREGAGLKDLAAAGLKDLALWAVQCDAPGVLAALRRNPQYKMSRCAWMEVIQSACEQRSNKSLEVPVERGYHDWTKRLRGLIHDMHYQWWHECFGGHVCTWWWSGSGHHQRTSGTSDCKERQRVGPVPAQQSEPIEETQVATKSLTGRASCHPQNWGKGVLFPSTGAAGSRSRSRCQSGLWYRPLSDLDLHLCSGCNFNFKCHCECQWLSQLSCLACPSFWSAAAFESLSIFATAKLAFARLRKQETLASKKEMSALFLSLSFLIRVSCWKRGSGSGMLFVGEGRGKGKGRGRGAGCLGQWDVTYEDWEEASYILVS